MCVCSCVRVLFENMEGSSRQDEQNRKRELSEADRVARNDAKKARRKKWKEGQRRLTEPIEMNGLRYFYPCVGGKKKARRIAVDYPMSSKEIPIIFRNDRIIVISKTAPLASIKTVGYGRSNVRSAVKRQLDLHGRFNLIHRLDVCTTGIMITSTDKKATAEIGTLIAQRKVMKIYLARVSGRFPEGKIVTCSMKVDGKDAFTSFLGVKEANSCGQDPSSLVIAFPKTGRKHQIRIHLKALGHPIANDPLHGRHDKRQSQDPYKDDDENRLLNMLLHAREKYSSLEGVSFEELDNHILAFKSRKCNGASAEDVRGPWGYCTRSIFLHAWIYAGEGMLEGAEDKKKWAFCAEPPPWGSFTLQYTEKEMVERLGVEKAAAALVCSNVPKIPQ